MANEMEFIGGIKVVKDEIVENYQSVLIVLTCNGKYVLARNKKRGGLEFPGGHKENEETIEETAMRESLEEVGAKIKNIQIKGYYILPTQPITHTTIITCAEVDEFVGLTGEFETENVDLYDEIPKDDLSFKDNIYQFIIDNVL